MKNHKIKYQIALEYLVRAVIREKCLTLRYARFPLLCSQDTETNTEEQRAGHPELGLVPG